MQRYIVSGLALIYLSIPIDVGAQQCTKLFPAPQPGQVGIYNKCSRCATAVLSWCDGSLHREDVKAKDRKIIKTCTGTVNLLDDEECSKPNQGKTGEKKVNANSTNSVDQKLTRS